MTQTYALAFDKVHVFKSKSSSIAFYKVQTTVGQRIKFLLEHYAISARNFSKQLGVAENNTQNYIRENKPAIPNADYLERIMLHFKSINPSWLLTGQGTPFLPDSPPTSEQTIHVQKNFRSPIVGANHGTANQQQHVQGGEEGAELQLAKQEIESLRQQLELHKALLASKEETINLLRGSYNRPN